MIRLIFLLLMLVIIFKLINSMLWLQWWITKTIIILFALAIAASIIFSPNFI